MDFITLREKLKAKQCPRWNDRQRRAHAYDVVREYRFFELLDDDFKDFADRYDGPDGQGDYRPLDKRRSAIDYRLPSIITRDVVAMLFGEGKFPIILFENDTDTKAASEIIRIAKLESLMNIAAKKASVGSVALIPEVFEDEGTSRLFIAVWSPWECEPVFRRMQPGVLELITRTWDVTRDDLLIDGYDLAALEKKWTKKLEGKLSSEILKFDKWYCRRRITTTESLWYEPVPAKVYEKADWDEWEEDRDTTGPDGQELPGRSVVHDLGFCPALWIAPQAQPGEVEGPCIFDGAINNEFAIERIASVGAQAIVTAGQPILATANKNGKTGLIDNLEGTDGHPAVGGNPRIGPEDVLEVDEAGGAWLVQLDAGAITPLDALIIRLRALSLENCGGSRITEDTLAGAKSGYAMELLDQALTYVAGEIRPAYADAVVALLRMIAKMAETFEGIEDIELKLNPDAKIKSIAWGAWYEPSGQDLAAVVGAAQAALEAGLIDTNTARGFVAQLFDVTDVEQMNTKIDAELKQRADDEQKRQLELKTAAPPKPAAEESP